MKDCLRQQGRDHAVAVLGEVVGQCKPVYFCLDTVDEELSHAPGYWLRCPEGLFCQVMRLLRDHKLGGRLHVVICSRDIVVSSVYRSGHAPRRGAPHTPAHLSGAQGAHVRPRAPSAATPVNVSYSRPAAAAARFPRGTRLFGAMRLGYIDRSLESGAACL